MKLTLDLEQTRDPMECVQCGKRIPEGAPHYKFPNRGTYCVMHGEDVEISDEEMNIEMERHRLKMSLAAYSALFYESHNINNNEAEE